MNPFERFTPATAPGAHAVLQQTQQQLGFLPDAMATMAGSPELVEAFTAASAAFHHTTLSALEREVVALTLGVKLDCHVCIAFHGRLLARLAPAHVEPLKAGRALAEPRLEALREATRQVLDQRGALDDAQLTAFIAAGFTRRQALELALAAGTFTLSAFSNRMTRAVVDPGLQS